MFDAQGRLGIEVFLFALMVFGMVLIIVFMVLHAKKQREGEDAQSLDQKKEEIMLLYFEVEDMINGLKEYVENARNVIELEFDRAKAEQEGLELGKVLRETQERTVQQRAPEPVKAPPAQEVYPEDGEALHETVREMARQNMSAAEIAEELQLSRSEVRLILRLGY